MLLVASTVALLAYFVISDNNLKIDSVILLVNKNVFSYLIKIVFKIFGKEGFKSVNSGTLQILP